MAENLYRLPAHPVFLQSCIWHDYDLAPRFSLRRGFLGSWAAKLEGRLRSVRVAHSKLITPLEFRLAAREFALN
ncbi:MAG: hypothetical protein JO105_18910 [Hyphomicrobiales bacterium]|nr:hypothetical protein [Hyphomicrobiales bacterium]